MPAHDERGARAEILRYCTRLWERRLVTGTSGNVSMRLSDGSIVVTPSGRSLGDLAESELVLVGDDGHPHDAAQRPTTELPLHLDAYRARSDVRAVLHAHPTFCVVWSRTGRIFAQDTVGTRETLGPVGWIPYFAPGSEELARSCATELARGTNSLLMERHGLTTVGATLEDAFVLADLAEEAARIAYYAALAGHGA